MDVRLLFTIVGLAWASTALAQQEPRKETPAPQQRSAAAGGSALDAEDRDAAAVDRNRDGRIAPEEFTVLRRR